MSIRGLKRARSIWTVLLAIAPLGAAQAQETIAPVATQIEEAALSEVAPVKPEAEAPPSIPTENFAGSSAFWGAQLSPDGTMMSFLKKSSGTTAFVITNLDTKQVVRAFATQPDDQLEWYRWVTEDKLLMSVSTMGNFFGEEVRFTRLILVQVQAGTLDYLFGKTSVVEGDNVIHFAEDGSHILVSMQKSVYDYPSVWRHELKTDGDARVVQTSRDGVWSWVADNKGVVRLGSGWQGRRLRIFYRPDAESDLKIIARLKENDEDNRWWDVLQVVSGSDTGYVLSEGESGRLGLRSFNFSTGEEIETVYENPDWDLSSVTLKEGKPFAAYFTADRDEVHWFDEARRKEYSGLRRALGDVEVWVVSRAKDNSRMLVWAGSEADPGVLYLYQPAANKLDQIAEFRPKLDFRLLAKPAPIKYAARDGTNISGYLTLPRGREAKNLPLIIMPHGGPYGIRDKLEYNDEVQLLANRGYAVLQPNFRGSGGYGESFEELGNGQIGRGMQDDVDDAMDWAVKQGIADPARVCVVGGSYGGYAAIWSVLRNPERYRCAASWAGVTDWDKMLSYDRKFFERGQNYRSWRETVRGEDVKDLKAISPYREAEKLNRPLLLAHGTKDIVVPFRQYTMFEKAASKAPVKPTTLVIKDEGHSFSSPENEKQWYDALEAFLMQHNPPE